MKLNKIVAAYFYDLAENVESGNMKDECVKGLLKVIMQIEEQKDSDKSEISSKDIENKKREQLEQLKDKKDMSPAGCLACELADMLGIGDLTSPGEFAMKDKPTIKIKIKKMSSTDDLNKILKELKEGGNIDLNTMNESLGDIFDLNSIQEIMDTPMFKQGGQIEQNETTLEDFLNG